MNEKVITIYELEREWEEKDIAHTTGEYFGQYVRRKESEGYKIIYSLGNREKNETKQTTDN